MRTNPINSTVSQHFKLCPESPSGVAWARDYHKGKAGDHVGSLNSGGYWCAKIMGVFYSMHRVVYELTHGYCPELVDHIDRDTTNNTPANLRPASHAENTRNAGLRADSSTGVKGLGWVKAKACWQGTIRYNGKTYTKGSTDRAVVEAWLATKRAELHGEFACH